MKDLIYLAAPYSHENHIVVYQRVVWINAATAALFAKGLFVFSPITHTHPIKELTESKGSFEQWAAYDYAMLDRCQRLLVLTLPGWDKSKGVTAEIAYWQKRGLPVEYMDFLTFEITTTP